MSEKPDKSSLSPAVIAGFFAVGVAVISLLGIEIQVYEPIHATQTAEARLAPTLLLNPIIPTDSPLPSATATLKYSDAVNVMDNFYTFINQAGNKEDLKKAWELETSSSNGLQCREAAGCVFSNFREFWWKLNVDYILYDCGSNIVDVELTLYPRDPVLTVSERTPNYYRYNLVKEHNQLKLNDGSSIEGPGSDCSLTVSRKHDVP